MKISLRSRSNPELVRRQAATARPASNAASAMKVSSQYPGRAAGVRLRGRPYSVPFRLSGIEDGQGEAFRNSLTSRAGLITMAPRIFPVP
jgi:hypothetical protein